MLLNTTISCLDFHSNSLAGLLMLLMLFSPVCSPRSHQSDFFQIRILCHSPPLRTIQYFLLSFNMTFETLQDLTPSVSPALPLNFPLTLCTLTHWSLGSLALHYSFYHRAFIHAMSPLVSSLHMSVPDSLPQRSLSDSPV